MLRSCCVPAAFLCKSKILEHLQKDSNSYRPPEPQPIEQCKHCVLLGNLLFSTQLPLYNGAVLLYKFMYRLYCFLGLEVPASPCSYDCTAVLIVQIMVSTRAQC